MNCSTTEEGFRLFRPKEGRPVVLFVGDSFTHAVEVSDSDTYYARICDALDLACFAYGGGGYGTLQEAMIIERYWQRIKPDLLVLQLSSNDPINNDYELEVESYENNNCLASVGR